MIFIRPLTFREKKNIDHVTTYPFFSGKNLYDDLGQRLVYVGVNTYKYEYKSDPVRAGETLTHDVKGPCLAAFSVFQRFACYEKYPQQSGTLIFLIKADHAY